jgi:O-antigen/teichoic acid export membrane protein
MLKQWFSDRTLRRVLKNTSWLVAGRVVTAITGLIYLSVVTHQLGVADFGTFTLVQTYVRIIGALTTFQAWQVVVRYGTSCLAKQDKAALWQLLKFTCCLDLVSALVSIGIAITIAPLLGPELGWKNDLIYTVQWCSLSILFANAATPSGLLRLYNRFDLLAFHFTILPIVQLLGTVIAAANDAPLWGYLLAWVVGRAIDILIVMGLAIYVAWRQNLIQAIISFPPPLSDLPPFNRPRADRPQTKSLAANHPGIWSFCFASNLNSSLPPLMQQATPIIIALVSNSSVVGLYRIAYELSTPLKELTQLFAQPLLPELAKLQTQQNWQSFKALLLKTSKILLGLGLFLLVVCIVFGKMILFYSFGAEFIEAYIPLVILVAAEVFTMGKGALEPALYAMGHPHLSLRINSIAILLVYFPALILLTSRLSTVGVSIAVLVSTILMFSLSTLVVGFRLRETS